MITISQSLKTHLANARQHLCLTSKTSQQSRRNFGERVLSIFLAKIMTAIFGFHGSGRLGRERNLLPRRWTAVKIRERVGGGEVKDYLNVTSRVLLFLLKPNYFFLCLLKKTSNFVISLRMLGNITEYKSHRRVIRQFFRHVVPAWCLGYSLPKRHAQIAAYFQGVMLWEGW